jgi:hypothetical protein
LKWNNKSRRLPASGIRFSFFFYQDPTHFAGGAARAEQMSRACGTINLLARTLDNKKFSLVSVSNLLKCPSPDKQ